MNEIFLILLTFNWTAHGQNILKALIFNNFSKISNFKIYKRWKHLLFFFLFIIIIIFFFCIHVIYIRENLKNQIWSIWLLILIFFFKSIELFPIIWRISSGFCSLLLLTNQIIKVLRIITWVNHLDTMITPIVIQIFKSHVPSYSFLM